MRKTRFHKTTLVTLSLMGMIASLAPSPLIADEFDGNVRLAVGSKKLDSDEWNTVDRQNEIGVIFDLKKSSWPVSISLEKTKTCPAPSEVPPLNSIWVSVKYGPSVTQSSTLTWVPVSPSYRPTMK